ncbi:hypothetical protein BDR26DRAFT_870293, partial [Obelidium mucronatum]
MQVLPNELIELIIGLIRPIKEQFKLATSLRFLRLRDKLLVLFPAAKPDSAAKAGRIDLLQHLYRIQQSPLEYSASALDEAAANGHSIVLWWFKSKGLTLKFTTKAVDSASQNGHLHILDWWRQNIPAEDWIWSNDAIDFAARCNHILVLKWWIDSGLRLKYSPDLVNNASRIGNIEVLNWWISQNKLAIFVDEKAMDHASTVEVLNFWNSDKVRARTGYPKWTSNSMKLASEAGRIDLLNWWKQSGLKPRWTSKAMDYASANGHIEVLQWWLDSGYPPAYSPWAMDWASQNCHIDILYWWFNSGLKLKFTVQSLSLASLNGHIDVLDWWLRSELHSEFSIPQQILEESPQPVKLWWKWQETSTRPSFQI